MEIRRVLLVDDEVDIRTIGELSLTTVGGWTVSLAADGESAVERARADRPDVILLDVSMPGWDGPRTLQALQSLPECADIPVIFLTAYTGAAERSALERLGVAGVVGKPFDPMALPAHVRRVLSRG